MSDPSPARNRRASRRLTAKRSTRVTCRPNALGVGRSVAVAMLDVSETGIRLLLTAALAPGRAVEVGLEGPWHHRPLTLPAQVVWSVPAADGHYVTGLRFDRALAYADLHQLAHL